MRTGHRAQTIAIIAVAAPCLLVACGGSSKEPKTLPPQTVSQAGPELEAPPPLPPPIRPVPVTPTETMKVIDAGEDPRPKTLVEASRLAKLQKAQSPPPVMEVTDENLAEQAEGGLVTIMSTGPAAPPPPADPLDSDPRLSRGAVVSAPAFGTSASRDETYWRRRGLSIRRNWRDAFDTIERLELEAAALRQQFYAQDDPYVRDNRIKPAWDRALDRIADLREEAVTHEEALTEYLTDGRQESIPAAWLNDGWELEPDAEELEAFDARTIPIDDAVDAPVLDDPAQNIESGGGKR